MDLDFTDSLKFLRRGIAQAHSDAVSDRRQRRPRPDRCVPAVITPDNAYVTPAVAGALPGFAGAGAFFARIFAPNVFSARNTTENRRSVS